MREEYKRRVDRKLTYEHLGRSQLSEGRRTQPKPFELRTDKRGEEKPLARAAILTFEVLISKGK